MHVKNSSNFLRSFLDKCLKDKNGNIVLFQKPNVPIILWAFFTIITLFISGTSKNISAYLAFGFLFTWSWLEITQGDTYFRRLLGVIVITYSLVGKL